MLVKVKYWGSMYTTYDRWFKENNCEEFLEDYRRDKKLYKDMYGYSENYKFRDYEGNNVDPSNATFEVLRRGVHGNYPDKDMYLIKETSTGDVFLFDKTGIEVIE